LEGLNFIVEQHEIITAGVVLLIVFAVGKFMGAYIEEYVRHKYKEKHTEECQCPAMDMVKEDIPAIKQLQKERTQQVSQMNALLSKLDASFERQEKNIDKLFTLFEEEWKSTIQELKIRR